LTLWDAGFQLSFAATLGLVLLTPILGRLLERQVLSFLPQVPAQGLLRYLRDYLIVTLAAMILVIPLVAYHFGHLSLAAPLANALILPAQPPIMALGGLATTIGMIPNLEPLARLVAWIPWLCLAYTTAVVRLLSAMPWASVKMNDVSWGWLIVYYSLALGSVWVVRQRQAATDRDMPLSRTPVSSRAVLGLLVAIMILAGLAIAQLPDGRLHLAFLDVGQGDAILVTTPHGQQILIDGGPSPAALTSALGSHMPFWDRSIDLLVLTHSDKDHATGLAEVLTHYSAGAWMDNGRPYDEAEVIECHRLLKAANVPIYSVRSGDRLQLGDGLVIEIDHPPPVLLSGTASDTNNNSLVLRLTWGQASFLLTGDSEAEAEQLLLSSSHALTADVLKIGHHGSGASSTPEFLEAVSPRFAVISVAADNQFGHPDQAVLKRLNELATTILRTDENGTIEFTTDGAGLWVKTQR
jgi:competence protein ComEC